MLRRPTSFLPIYITSSASLLTKVCVRTRVAMGVTDRVWSIRVLLAVTTVRKISIRVDFRGLRGLWVRNIGLSVA